MKAAFLYKITIIEQIYASFETSHYQHDTKGCKIVVVCKYLDCQSNREYIYFPFHAETLFCPATTSPCFWIVLDKYFK